MAFYSGPMTLPPANGLPIPASIQSSPNPMDHDLAASVTPDDSMNPYLIPDGFLLNVHLKYLPYRSYPMQVRLLDQYRREALQGMWQPRWRSIPQDVNTAIAAGDTLNYEFRVARGSVLWGYSFAVISPATVGNFRVTISDVCRQVDLMTQFEISSAMRANFTTGSPRTGYGCVLLSQPYPVSGPGDMQANIVNVDTAARKCQLLLLFIEPAGSPQ